MSEVEEQEISGLTVRIERESCIATGACCKLAPEVFELDDRQIVSFAPDPPDVERERLIEACQVCPVEALSVIDEDGGVLVP